MWLGPADACAAGATVGARTRRCLNSSCCAPPADPPTHRPHPAHSNVACCRASFAGLAAGWGGAAGGWGGAAADPRCSLLGVHAGGRCVCDKGWAGASCSVADLKPLNTALGYDNASAASWGGRPVEDPTTGVWHLIVSQLSHRCPLVMWTNNSRVVRAESSTGPAGPYKFAAEVYREFHHNPSSAQPILSQPPRSTSAKLCGSDYLPRVLPGQSLARRPTASI